VSTKVVHAPERERYEILVDGELAGITEAHPLEDGTVLFSHTEVADEFEGEGLASVLVTEALDDIRRRGLRIHVTCEYVKGFLKRHEEYRDLVA
jgi:uncharacterized protein